MSQTGRRVAEMHLALAGSDEFADFAPEPIATRGRASAGSTDVVTRAERVFDALEATPRRASGKPIVSLVDQLLAQRADLQDRLSALLPPDIDGLNIRHHGDFHLGQILIVKDDIFIIDFEGEPRRSLDERRRKAPAGARRRRPDPLDRLFGDRRAGARAQGRRRTSTASSARRWRNGAIAPTAAFLAAYRETMTNPRLWPADPAAAEQMLNFFLLEKAIYEIEYELAHRPEWLRVPLTGLLRILSAADRNEAS